MTNAHVRLWCLALAALSAGPAAGLELPIPDRPRPEPAGPGKPVVVVYDFTSEYDGGRMGKLVGKNVWAKMDRSGRCVLIERDDVNAAVAEAKFAPGFDRAPAEIVTFTTQTLAATHAIWGKVEQVDETGPVSERRLKISARAAGSKDEGKELLLDCHMTVANQRAIQLATREIVRRFFDITRPEPDVGAEEEKRWKTGPNLIKNGGFETGTTHPEFWEAIRDDPKHPQHRCVSWVRNPDGKGKCIKFTIPKDIAATYGVAYYSAPVSIKDGEIYRVSVRVRSNGSKVKIFMKHYKFFPPGPNETKGQWRETRRAPMNCYFERKNEWQTFTRDFRPHRDDHEGRFDPEITRVELYAYWPKGIVYFDDVVLKKLKDREPK
jgi:hypothetical protein